MSAGALQKTRAEFSEFWFFLLPLSEALCPSKYYLFLFIIREQKWEGIHPLAHYTNAPSSLRQSQAQVRSLKLPLASPTWVVETSTPEPSLSSCMHIRKQSQDSKPRPATVGCEHPKGLLNHCVPHAAQRGTCAMQEATPTHRKKLCDPGK